MLGAEARDVEKFVDTARGKARSTWTMDMGRYGEIWGEMANYRWDVALHGEIWGDMGRYEEIWRDMGRCAEIWGEIDEASLYTGRYGEI